MNLRQGSAGQGDCIRKGTNRRHSFCGVFAVSFINATKISDFERVGFLSDLYFVALGHTCLHRFWTRSAPFCTGSELEFLPQEFANQQFANVVVLFCTFLYLKLKPVTLLRSDARER